MNSKIDQEVIDELIAMLEDHIAGGLKPKSAEPDSEEIPGVEGEESGEIEVAVKKEMPAEEDDEDMKALMEMYSKG